MTTSKFQIGQIIKFGLLSLRVISVLTDNKHIAFIYTLESIDGKINYEYIPKKYLHVIKNIEQ